MEKYVIKLEAGYFRDYVETRLGYEGSNYYYIFEGSLSYAYYENVLVEFSSSHNSSSMSGTVRLNVRGYAKYRIREEFIYGISIDSASGNVIFWV